MLMHMRYAGGKGADGTFQRIISLMPPHEIYIEPFYGGGSIMQRKRPAKLNIGIDRDRAAIEKARPPAESRNGASANAEKGEPAPKSASGSAEPLSRTIEAPDGLFCFYQEDGIGYLEWTLRMAEQRGILRAKSDPMLIYCDPPYMRHTCASRCRYKYDLTDADHRRLLRVLQELNALPDPPMLMISGYDSELYREMLTGGQEFSPGPWNHIAFQAMTRGGKQATEHLWFNFAPPKVLHDYRYMGTNFRDRERMKRCQAHWVNRLRKMPEAERQALLSAIRETASTGDAVPPRS
jgi:hypothetical protein